MQQMHIIIYQSSLLGILVLIGIIGVKFKVITPEIKNGLAKLVIDITLPLLLLTTFSKMELSTELITNGSFVFLFSYISILMLTFAGKTSAKIFKLNEFTGTIHKLHTIFGNVVFLGFPLINALYPGGEGLFYAMIYQFANDSTLWTIGVYNLNKNENGNIFKNLTHLINPNTAAFLIGIMMMINSIKLPSLLQDSLGGLGHTTIYLSMLYIGAVLAQANIKKIFKHFHVFILSINKLIIVPIILLFIITFSERYLGLEISEMAKTVTILQAAMPCMAIVVVLAKKYAADDIQATENVFISTVLGSITLPFIYYLIQLV